MYAQFLLFHSYAAQKLLQLLFLNKKIKQFIFKRNENNGENQNGSRRRMRKLFRVGCVPLKEHSKKFDLKHLNYSLVLTS